MENNAEEEECGSGEEEWNASPSGDDEWSESPAEHKRTILHLDVDCFYAQVEMVRNPSLRDKPVGIKQKNLMVTCNYKARSLGVKKHMWIDDAMKVLPELVLVDGSDLTPYRHVSAQMSAIAQELTPNVERLGLDEVFVDVTDIITDYSDDGVEGHIYGDKEPNIVDLGDPCGCGCRKRLLAGAKVARQLRQKILEATGITTCAGIAHNKLLAKLVCGYHKPNEQTVVFPWQVPSVMNSLNSAKSIPGIGSATFKILEEIGISKIQELQNASLSLLKSKFDDEISKKLKDMSYGVDETAVKKSGKVQSIGIEEALTNVSSMAEVRITFHTLIERILKLLAEDGRVPGCLKVSVRKYDKIKKFSAQRETRQVPVSPSLFPSGVGNVSDKTQAVIMKVVMGLFHKMVDVSKDYQLTLLGIGFSKFVERATEKRAISSFFMKRAREQSSAPSVNHAESKRMKYEMSTPMSEINRKSEMSCVDQDLTIEDVDNPDQDSDNDINYTEYTSSNTDCSEFQNTYNNTGLAFESHTCNSDREVNASDITDRPKAVGVTTDSTDDSRSISCGQSAGEMINSDIHNSTLNTSLSSEPSISEEVQIRSEDVPLSKVNDKTALPSEFDQEVFNSLPSDMQEELLKNYSNRSQSKTFKLNVTPKSKPKFNTKSSSPKYNKLDKYFRAGIAKDSNRSLKDRSKIIKSQDKPVASRSHHKLDDKNNIDSQMASVSSETSPRASVSSETSPMASVSSETNQMASVSSETSPINQQSPTQSSEVSDSFLIAKGVDPEVYRSLPVEIQQEILQSGMGEGKRNPSVNYPSDLVSNARSTANKNKSLLSVTSGTPPKRPTLAKPSGKDHIHKTSNSSNSPSILKYLKKV